MGVPWATPSLICFDFCGNTNLKSCTNRDGRGLREARRPAKAWSSDEFSNQSPFIDERRTLLQLPLVFKCLTGLIQSSPQITYPLRTLRAYGEENPEARDPAKMGAAHSEELSTEGEWGLCHLRPNKSLSQLSHEPVLARTPAPLSTGCGSGESKDDIVIKQRSASPSRVIDLSLGDMTTKQLIALRHEMAARSRSLTSAANAAEQRQVVLDDLMGVQSILPTILFDPLEALDIVRGGMGHKRTRGTSAYPPAPSSL